MGKCWYTIRFGGTDQITTVWQTERMEWNEMLSRHTRIPPCFLCAMHMASYDFSSTIKNYACCAYENFMFSGRFLWGNYQGVVLADHSGSICSAPWNQVMEMLKQRLRMFVPRKFHVSFVLESRSIMLHLDHGCVFRRLRNKGIHFRFTKEWLSPHHSISD